MPATPLPTKSASAMVFNGSSARIMTIATMLLQKQSAIDSLKTGSVEFHFDEGSVKAKINGVLDTRST